MTAIQSAMVLAAGFGTRMRPLTDTVPKPLIQVAGRTLLDRVLDGLSRAGLERAVVNVHYLPDHIVSALAHRTAPRITISDERDAVLDTGGGVKKALPLLGDGAFVVHNSDSIWIDRDKDNLSSLLHAFDAERMAALLLLAPTESSIGYDGKGDFRFLPDDRLERRKPEDTAPYVFTGVSIISPSLFGGIEDEVFSLNRIFDVAAGLGQLHGKILDGTWMHVGTPGAVIEAEACIETWRRRNAA